MANTRGVKRPPARPIAPAAMTIAGNGTSNSSATNAATLMAQSAGCFSARVPMRHAAAMTMATTAGLIP
jgi:hypothetical protein